MDIKKFKNELVHYFPNDISRLLTSKKIKGLKAQYTELKLTDFGIDILFTVLIPGRKALNVDVFYSDYDIDKLIKCETVWNTGAFKLGPGIEKGILVGGGGYGLCDMQTEGILL